MSLETFGRYQLLKKLAAGGMAQIYLARQQGLEGFEKLLVVKRILPHLAENQDFITMFLDEARIAARLNHPNVVQIFDLGAQDDTYFIAMEFIHGEDVRRVWKHAEREDNPIPLALICRIVIDACAGLDYAHKKSDQSGRPLNIVHRDISPQNILVSFEGAVKVVDFGIAKAADQSTVTQSGVLKGKYSYMSPEQAAGQPIDSRTDIFALGVVLYELLTNTRLFKRQNDIQTLNAVTECAVVPPSTVNPEVPPELDAIVMKALAKNRDARFQEARQLGAALEAWLLTNQLPGSTSALSAFMHQIYARRLQREAEEGRLLLETGENESFAERATPSGEFKRSRATASRKLPSRAFELTVASRPSRSDLRKAGSVYEPTEASLPTQAETSRRGLVAASLAVVALLLGGGLAWQLFSDAGEVPAEVAPPRPPERPAEQDGTPIEAVVTPTRFPLRIDSTPVGAHVSVNGQARGVTPLSLELDEAVVELQLTLDGYLDVEEHVDARDVDARHYTLAPGKKGVVGPRPPVSDRQLPTPREKATVRFFGAEARVDCPRANFRGDTPPSDKQLPVGEYVCTFTSTDGKKSTQTVRVEPGVTTKVRIEFP